MGFDVSWGRRAAQVQQHFADERRSWDPSEVLPYLELYAQELTPHYHVELDEAHLRLVVQKKDAMITRFKCSVCGLITTGRLPRGPWGAEGDGTLFYPRRHKVAGKPCEGNWQESEWVDVPVSQRVYGGSCMPY